MEYFNDVKAQQIKNIAFQKCTETKLTFIRTIIVLQNF